MPKMDLIKKIEGKRGSKVITYITSDRQGPVNARVAMDISQLSANSFAKLEK